MADKQEKKKTTILVFSSDLDKVLCSFVIATSAASMGADVTMFFTFWGLNVLRKKKSKACGKSLVDKMFALMMPKGVENLKLSKMNMAGMGTWMMKKVMKKKNVASLEELMESARGLGVKLVACEMSMEIMGIKREELFDNIEVAGAASYVGETEQANVNLFI